MGTTSTSTRPYLIRALHEWCTDNALTPYLRVKVDHSVQVPQQFVQDGEIVLNISWDATTDLKIDQDFLSFKARFSGVAKEVMVPVERILAIFARENGQGMAFPVVDEPSPAPIATSETERSSSTSSRRPTLTRIK